MRSHFGAMIALVAVATVPTFAHAKSAPPGEASVPPKSKEDRLADAVEQLAKPTALIYDGNLAGGQAQFEALLAETRRKHGETSVEAADLIYMFGLTASMAAIMASDERLKAMELSYGAAAVAAYRAALGPINLDVADAIQTQAATLAKTNSDNPPAAADKLLDEALQIRRASLGKDDSGTRQIMRIMADHNGLPARTGRDPTRIAAVAAEFEGLIAISPMVTHGNIGDSAAAVRFELAEMYARNGMIDQAVAEAAKARMLILSWPENYRCGGIELLTAKIEPALEEGGDKQASATKERIIKASPTPCAADLLP